MTNRTTLLFLALSFWGSPVPAQDVPGMTSNCHLLMTEQECAGHRAKLAALPEGDSRVVYLAAHTHLMQEREQACACFRDASGKIRSSDNPRKPARLNTHWF